MAEEPGLRGPGRNPEVKFSRDAAKMWKYEMTAISLVVLMHMSTVHSNEMHLRAAC